MRDVDSKAYDVERRTRTGELIATGQIEVVHEDHCWHAKLGFAEALSFQQSGGGEGSAIMHRFHCEAASWTSEREAIVALLQRANEEFAPESVVGLVEAIED